MKRTLAILSTGISLTVLLAGCLNANVGTRVQEDGSGTLVLRIQLSTELVEGLYEFTNIFNAGSGSQRISKEDFVNELFSDFDEGQNSDESGLKTLDVQRIENGVEASYSFDDYESLEKFFSNPANGLFSTFDIQKEGDEWTLSADLSAFADSFDTPTLSEIGGVGGFSGIEGMVASSLGIPDPEIYMSFEFPGEVIEANTPLIEGSKAVWKITGEGTSEINGKWSASGGEDFWSNVLVALIILSSVVVVTALGLAFFTGRDNSLNPIGKPIR